MYPFGSWLTQQLSAAGITQAELRRRMAALPVAVEVTEGAISQWVNGLVRPRREHAAALLTALDASDAVRLEAHAQLARPRTEAA